MTRDELIVAGERARRLESWKVDGDVVEAVIDAVEDLIREDEQNEMLSRMGAPGGIRDLVLSDLRAKVKTMFTETLPPYLFRHNEDVLFPKMERTMLNDAIRDVWEQAKVNVLALLDGGSDDDA